MQRNERTEQSYERLLPLLPREAAKQPSGGRTRVAADVEQVLQRAAGQEPMR